MSDESTALAVIDSQPQQDISQAWTQDDLRALQETVAKDCNSSQFKVFVAACKRLQLDPFARQITPIVMGGRMTPQVTIDGFRLIAERTRKYRGRVGPYWCGPDGEWKDAWLADTAPVACKVGVRREGFAEIVWGTARTKAYSKGGLWVTMPDVMIAKVAESIALRVAFPNELSGVYTREEMQQALREEDDANYVEADSVSQPPRHQQQPATAAKTWKELRLYGARLGWSVADYEEEMKRVCGDKPAREYTADDKAAWQKHLETQLARKAAAEAKLPAATVTEETEPAEAEPIPFDLRTAPIKNMGA